MLDGADKGGLRRALVQRGHPDDHSDPGPGDWRGSREPGSGESLRSSHRPGRRCVSHRTDSSKAPQRWLSHRPDQAAGPAVSQPPNPPGQSSRTVAHEPPTQPRVGRRRRRRRASEARPRRGARRSRPREARGQGPRSGRAAAPQASLTPRRGLLRAPPPNPDATRPGTRGRRCRPAYPAGVSRLGASAPRTSTDVWPSHHDRREPYNPRNRSTCALTAAVIRSASCRSAQ